MSKRNIRALSFRREPEKNLFEEISKLARAEAPQEAYRKLADEYLMDESVLYGTASFYDFLKPGSAREKIRVCNGTACLTANRQHLVEKEARQMFDEEEIGHATCLGHCHTGGAFMYEGVTYSLPENGDLRSLIASGKSNKRYDVVAVSEPVLTGEIPSVEEFYREINRLLEQNDDIAGELKASGLRGRGGAGFPFHIKWDTVRRQQDETKYIVCNADEGDPGAFSDMYLLEEQPHKVLAGMYIAGITAGAHEAYIYIRGEYPQSVEAFQRAIDEAKDHIKDFRIRIIRGQGSYVCGEETALLNSIEGLRPEVRVRPPYPAVEGLYGKPTLLSNVETFANLPRILTHGGERFAALGTDKSTGTKLVSLDSHFVRPGIYEVEMGMPAGKLFYDTAGGFRRPLKAVQIGGPLGGVVPVDKLETLTLDFESMDEAGFLLGHAGVAGIPEDFPMIEFIEHLLKFTADESCGKCYPCRIGSRRGQELINKAIVDNIPVDRQLFDDLLETLELGSLCALGGGLPLPVRNIMQHFAGELKEYFS